MKRLQISHCVLALLHSFLQLSSMPAFLYMRVTFSIISYCGCFLLVRLDLKPAHHVNSKEFGHGRLMHAVVRQMRTDPLHLFSPRLSLPDPDEEAIRHMFLCCRCKIEERRPEWRGGVISWQRLISALSPRGGKMFYSPLLLLPKQREILKEKK